MNKKITELFISYQQALELKELGFDEPCLAKYAIYNPGDEMNLFPQSQSFSKGYFEFFQNSHDDTKVAAPSFSQAFRWFREKHNLFSLVSVDQTMEPKFCYALSKYADPYDWAILVFNSELYYTYEEAELACLKKLIEIVKNK